MKYTKEITEQEKHSYMAALLQLPVIDSSFEEGYSYVSIATPDGTFEGHAYVSPEDYAKGHYTSLSGQLIAHYRSLIKFVKYHKRILLHSYQVLNNIYSTNKKYNSVSDDLKHYLFNIEYQIQLDKEMLKYLENLINKKIANAEKYYKKGQK